MPVRDVRLASGTAVQRRLARRFGPASRPCLSLPPNSEVAKITVISAVLGWRKINLETSNMKKLVLDLLARNIEVFLENGKLKATAKKGALSKDAIELIAQNKEALLAYLLNDASTALEARQPVVTLAWRAAT